MVAFAKPHVKPHTRCGSAKDSGLRFYSPEISRWLSPDPIGEIGGLNRYGFVGNGPANGIDPLGEWGYSIHSLGTYRMAVMAGFSRECARVIARRGNLPDEDPLRDSMMPVNAFEDPELAVVARSWHFPTDTTGVVVPGSEAARSRYVEGIRGGDITLFAEGLHPLQDSWSHQGRPYIAGVGHPSGYSPARGRLDGFWAAVSRSADDPEYWPADVRAALIATFDALMQYRQSRYDVCATCRGLDGREYPLFEGESTVRRDVEIYLLQRYPGENIISGEDGISRE
jgi:RHS repeat-associated protein